MAEQLNSAKLIALFIVPSWICFLFNLTDINFAIGVTICLWFVSLFFYFLFAVKGTLTVNSRTFPLGRDKQTNLTDRVVETETKNPSHIHFLKA